MPAPSWEPEQISSQAFEQLDANSDGAIDGQEAQNAPGLAAALVRIDADQDGRMTREEIKNRIELYARLGTGLISQTFQVMMNGRPAIDTRVEFVPDQFLGNVIRPASGFTDGSGFVSPQTAEQSIPAMQVGFYRVVLYSFPDDKPLPVKDSIGVEVSPVSTADSSGTPVLSFKSR